VGSDLTKDAQLFDGIDHNCRQYQEIFDLQQKKGKRKTYSVVSIILYSIHIFLEQQYTLFMYLHFNSPKSQQGFVSFSKYALRFLLRTKRNCSPINQTATLVSFPHFAIPFSFPLKGQPWRLAWTINCISFSHCSLAYH
jgi:hypothetical protein